MPIKTGPLMTPPSDLLTKISGQLANWQKPGPAPTREDLWHCWEALRILATKVRDLEREAGPKSIASASVRRIRAGAGSNGGQG